MQTVFSILFPAPFSALKTSWKKAWNIASFKRQFILTFTFIAFIAVAIPHFFRFIQNRPGYRLDDIVLNQLPAQDMSWFIFLLIYAVILLSIVNIVSDAFLFLKCMQAYGLLLVLRITCMYFVSLEPEKFIIPLQDPILGYLFYNGSPITKDLFFSGHISTMTLLCFAIPFRPLKYFFIVATLLAAVFILIQHVHYTIDILAAPLFAWLCYYVMVSNYGKHKRD